MTPVGEYVVYYIAAPGIPLITTASSSVLFCHLRLPAVFEACFPHFILMTSLPFCLWMPFYFIAVSTVGLVRQWPSVIVLILCFSQYLSISFPHSVWVVQHCFLGHIFQTLNSLLLILLTDAR